MPRPFSDPYKEPIQALVQFMWDELPYYPGLTDTNLNKEGHIVVQWGRTAFHSGYTNWKNMNDAVVQESKDGLIVSWRGRRWLRVPGIFAGYKRTRQRQRSIGNVYSTDGQGRYTKALRYETTLELDIWAKTNIEYITLAGQIGTLFFEKRNPDLQRRGFVDCELIGMADMGFDLGDRILQSHSHQEIPILRMRMEFGMIYDAVPPAPAPQKGGTPISQVIVVMSKHDGTELATMQTGDETVYYLLDHYADIDMLEVLC